MSKQEIAYYQARKKRAEGFIARHTAKHEEKMAIYRKDVAECEAKLSELTEDLPCKEDVLKPKDRL